MLLREIFVKLGLDVDAQSFAKGEGAVEIIKAGLSKLVEFGKEVVEQVNAVSEFGEHVRDLAQTTGLTTDSLQRLGKAAANEGIGMDEFGHSMVILSRTMASAKEGSEESAKAFSKIGVSISKGGKLRSAGDVFKDLSDKIAKMPDGAEKTALALKLMGRSGAEMIPVLNQGREEIEALGGASSVMTEEQIEAGDQVVKMQRKLEAQTKSLWREAIAPLLPTIRDLLKKFYDWKKANAEILKQKIKQYISAAIEVIKKAAAIFDFLVRNLTFIKIALVAATAMWLPFQAAAISAAIKTAASWALAALPFVAIAAAVTALMLIFDDLNVYSKGGKSLFGRFEKQIKEWARADNPDDPWWLKALKMFVNLIVTAIAHIRDFQELFDDTMHKKSIEKLGESAGVNMKEIHRRGENSTLKQAKFRLAQNANANLTDSEKSALKNQGVTEEAFRKQYSAGAAGGAGSSNVTNNNQTVHVEVNASPGMTEEGLAKAFNDQLQGTLGDAGAAAQPVP